MTPRRIAIAPWIPLFLLALTPISAGAGTYEAQATTDAAGVIRVQWTYTENPSAPSGRPEWVGYDVMRRYNGMCVTEYARVNDTTFPRTMGQTQSYTFVDATAVKNSPYAYRVIPVDASHNELALAYPECDLCSQRAYAVTPLNAVAITVGTLQDLGWTLYVNACSYDCWDTGFYLAGNWPQELRAYADGSSVVMLWGTAACNAFEGCALTVDRWEVTQCGVTPVSRTSWGRLKTIYR